MRRPPDSLIPRQFLKDSEMSLWVGIVVIVLSQFCTFTVCSATSMTSPSALNWGISIQSPTRTMSFEASCSDATKDRIVSRKMSRITAISAPILLRKKKGDWSASLATTTTPPMTNSVILAICT